MLKQKNSIDFMRICLVVLLSSLISPFCFHAQNFASSKKAITAEFLIEEVEFNEIALMTNVLKVKNNNGKNYTFTISLNIPNGWRSLLNEEKEYVLKPNDSVFIPVRVLTTNKKARGGTKYSIAAYVNTNEGKQMAYSRFTAGRPKITNWQMHVLPRPRIYFLNGESNSTFQLNVSNEGDEEQDVIVNMQKQGTDLVVKDSVGKILKKNYFELKLPAYTDTTMSFNVQVFDKIRNLKRIDIWNYNPSAKEKERRYGIFLRASEVRLDQSGGGMKSKKVDFVKLANSIDFVKLNNTSVVGNGSNTIPLTVFANVNNLLGQQPIANIVFQGNSQVGKSSTLNYQFQTGFLFYKYSNEFLTNRLNGNIVLNVKRGYVGFITGGANGMGQGNSAMKTFIGGYQINSNHAIGASIGRQRFFGQSSFNFLGLNYAGSFSIVRLNLLAGVTQNPTGKLGYNFRSNVSLLLSKQTTLGLFGNYQFIPFTSTQSYLLTNYGFNFNTAFKRYSGFISFNYISNQLVTPLSTTNVNTSYIVNMNNSYHLKKGYSFQLNTFYTTINSPSFLPTPSTSNMVFGNVLSFNPKPKKRPIQISPAVYVNYSRFFNDTLLSGGGQFNFSKSNFENNFFAGGTVRMGYNKLLSDPQFGSIFNLQSNIFMRYRVWNIIGMYNYGPLGNYETATILKSTINAYPQTIRLSVGHQYQFKNLHFVLENNPTYMYLNSLKRHSFSLFSQLFYFTDNNFRVSVNATINFTSGLSYIYDYSPSGTQFLPVETNQTRITDKSVLFGVTLKKNFAIPIPKRFRNKKFCDANFVVFLDVNGNGKMEESEVPVENIVLRMGEYEVITDEKGRAGFVNTSFAKYHVQVIPLIDMGSWFPNIDDSVDVCGPDLMYIPFTKGTQVYGTVELDHETYSGEIFDKLDVSRFKIYLIDSAGRTFSSITDNKGNFNFYVPHAKYTLKFDEKALGTGFYLPENDISLDLRHGIESYYHHFLIIQKKRKVKKKIFGPDGKVTYVEEEGSSSLNKNDQNKNQVKNTSTGKSGKGLNKNSGPDSSAVSAVSETKLDSLIDLLNRLMAKMASKADVRSIVKQEMQDLIDQLNATFTIQVDELPNGTLPTGLLLQLSRLKKVESFKSVSGSTVYYSGDYKNINDAEKFCRDFQTSGFRKARVINKKQLLKKVKK